MRNFKKYIILFVILTLVFSLSGCGKKDREEAEENYSEIEESEVTDYKTNSTHEVYEEEYEDAEVNTVKSDKDSFYGNWVALSDTAEYFYGNVEITINEDGTWKANITEMDMEGTWKLEDGMLKLTSDVYDCQLAFADTGNLVMQEEIDDEFITTVLTKQ